ncbi:MAG: GDSL-type esterase/lipase family protein [bacterium]|nr:GDSL-type esterase/lipase family protein [bacterium]
MAKKKNVKDISSTYNRYQQDDNTKRDNLDSTQNLDVSFAKGGLKIATIDKTEVLYLDEIEKANEEFNSSKGSKISGVIIAILVVICFILGLFILYHFITFDHSKEKVVVKTQVKEEKIVDDNYLFLGDSITEFYDLDKYYEGLPVVNSGVSGYTTSNILENMEKMVYQYNPSKVFLLIGTNDLEILVDNDKIVDNIEEIIKKIKENRPYAKLYIESIYPINNSDNEKISLNVVNGNRKNADIIAINEKLKQMASTYDATYIDLYNELVDEDGLLRLEYTVDGLHLSDEGYMKVSDVLINYIKK